MSAAAPSYDTDRDTVVVDAYDRFRVAENRDGTYDLWIATEEGQTPEQFSLNERSVTLEAAIRVIGAGVPLSQASENTIRAAFAGFRIAEHVQRGTEHLARERYGDRVVDQWFRAHGWDPDAGR